MTVLPSVVSMGSDHHLNRLSGSPVWPRAPALQSSRHKHPRSDPGANIELTTDCNPPLLFLSLAITSLLKLVAQRTWLLTIATSQADPHLGGEAG